MSAEKPPDDATLSMTVHMPGYTGPTLGDLVDLLEPGQMLRRIGDGPLEVVNMRLVFTDGPVGPEEPK